MVAAAVEVEHQVGELAPVIVAAAEVTAAEVGELAPVVAAVEVEAPVGEPAPAITDSLDSDLWRPTLARSLSDMCAGRCA